MPKAGPVTAGENTGVTTTTEIIITGTTSTVMITAR
jgi:hypothetical protein